MVNKQRRVIYEQRRRVLELDDLREILLEMADSHIPELVQTHTQGFSEDWDLEGLQHAVRAFLPLEGWAGTSDWARVSQAEIIDQLQGYAQEVYDQNRERIGQDIVRELRKSSHRLDQLAASESPPGLFSLLFVELRRRLPSSVWTQMEVGLMANLSREDRDVLQTAVGELMVHRRDRAVLMRTVDSLWIRHLTDLDILREGIGLRAYAQQDPLVAFKKEAHEMYTALLGQIQQDVVGQVFRPITFRTAERAVPQPRRELVTNIQGDAGQGRPARKAKTSVGRNDPCPCGSGKKYKNCHLRQGAGTTSTPGAERRPRKRRRPR